MKHIAFYAPMKPPDHPTPSGDREMARALILALQKAGFEVSVVSSLRSRNGSGDEAEQTRIQEEAESEVSRIAADFEARGAPDLWFTYHLYHKAPDLLGPELTKRFDLPYCVAEASLAAKRKDGPWSDFYAQSLAAIRHADRIFQLNPQDSDGLRSVLGCGLPIVPLDPFLVDPPAPMASDLRQQSRRELAARHGLDPEKPWMLAVGMMRPDSKRDSYKLLAEAFGMRADTAVPLLIVGDGPARPEIEGYFRDHPKAVFLGALPRERLNITYGMADLFVWPAINEAFGMALLEAQAAGLPVVAGNRPGVAAMIVDGETGILAPEGDTGALAEAINQMVADATMRESMSVSAISNVAAHHSLEKAAQRLSDDLLPLIGAWS